MLAKETVAQEHIRPDSSDLITQAPIALGMMALLIVAGVLTTVGRLLGVIG